MPFALATLLCATLLPAVLALILGWVLRKHPAWDGAVLALAVALGHLAVGISVQARLLPPQDGPYWLIASDVALVAALAGLGRWLKPGDGSWSRAVIAWAGMAIALGLGAWLVLRPLQGLAPSIIAAWSVGTGLLLLPLGILLLTRCASRPALATNVLGIISLAGTAVVIGCSGSKDLALVTGLGAAAFTGLALVRLRTGSTVSPLPLLIAIQALALLTAHHYAELKPMSGALALAALPVGLLVAWRIRRPWLWLMVVGLVTAAILGGTAGWIIASAPADPYASYGG